MTVQASNNYKEDIIKDMEQKLWCKQDVYYFKVTTNAPLFSSAVTAAATSTATAIISS